jgi:hypothetical protein
MTPETLQKAGLEPDTLAQPHLMLDDSRPGFRPGTHDVSLMRGGVVFADRVTTVSPTYACEVYRPDFGFGMQVRGIGDTRCGMQVRGIGGCKVWHAGEGHRGCQGATVRARQHVSFVTHGRLEGPLWM